MFPIEFQNDPHPFQHKRLMIIWQITHADTDLEELEGICSTDEVFLNNVSEELHTKVLSSGIIHACPLVSLSDYGTNVML